eukprot:Phypoly_transcript_21899.p1 GENE.Phypoly_transcript_21899~~Phypoly_transcript_21899.p1  ORF type:complete len:209 (+),score=34.27 Phypoly_transcript_21899:74-628(+)
MRYFHENGFLCDAKVLYNSATKSFECLKFAFENCTATIEEINNKFNLFWPVIARSGNLEALKYVHEKGCTWKDTECEIAATHGHVAMLKYAHENGCSWHASTCSAAAAGGHLDCLRYAHENGCAWDEKTTLHAFKRGNLDCLRYALENGCPFNPNMEKQNLRHNPSKEQTKCANFLREFQNRNS